MLSFGLYVTHPWETWKAVAHECVFVSCCGAPAPFCKTCGRPKPKDA